jgi:hypothetical protein
MTDDELLARQDALQDEAAAVLDDLDLIARISRVGRPIRTGSAALGLMVARDIDVTSLCPNLAVALIWEAVAPLALNPHISRLAFRNDTGRWNTDPRYPDGLYWMIEYVSDGGEKWNLDLWFLLDGTTQFDLVHMETLPRRLDRDARVAILRIKTDLHERPPSGRIPSYRVYEAVLDRGIRTQQEFRRDIESSASLSQ